MDVQIMGKGREGVLLFLWQHPRDVLMHFSQRALHRSPSLTWKSPGKECGPAKRRLMCQGVLSTLQCYGAQQGILWLCPS